MSFTDRNVLEFLHLCELKDDMRTKEDKNLEKWEKGCTLNKLGTSLKEETFLKPQEFTSDGDEKSLWSSPK